MKSENFVGKKILHYKIMEKLGAGGMGVVYKAEDTKLKRTVALKFLPPEMTRDGESKERFIKEAQAASSLEHTNICNIHEINETEDGHMYICMAFYEGETLKDKIKKGPLRIEEALEIGAQIADGLVKAHERGIVHRDIKPANVIITEDGSVKIVDFGLAKLSGHSGLTRTGTTLGTVAYMSPEQASGAKIDHRTDVWSLGIILYEMITGQLPFKAELFPAVIYAILNEEHEPVTSLRSGIPLDFERIVNKSLEKEPNDRYQSVADLRTDLRKLSREITASPTVSIRATARTRKPRPRIKISKRQVVAGAVIAAAFFLGVVLTIIAYSLFTASDKGGDVVSVVPAETAAEQKAEGAKADLSFAQLTGGGGISAFPSWSPDGRWVVYASDEAGNMDVWKIPIDGGQAQRLTSSPANEINPAWNPNEDDPLIAFASDQDGGGIFIIHPSGGTPTQLIDSEGQPLLGQNPVWSPDGETLAYHLQGDIFLFDYSKREVTLLVKGTSAAPFVVWGPEGKKLIFWHRTKGDICLVSRDGSGLETLELIPPGEEVTGIAWSGDGERLVYCRGPFGGNKSIWMVSIDPDSGKPSGKPTSLTNPLTDDVHCAISPSGNSIAFAMRQVERHLWYLNINGKNGLATGEAKQITTKGGRNYYPAASPDGKKVVWTSHRSAKGVLYFMDLENGAESKVTQDWLRSSREVNSSISPDGEKIAYATTKGGSYNIHYIRSLGSVGLPVTETENPTRDSSAAWSPDGATIAFYSNRSGNWDIWSVAVTGNGDPKRLTRWESNENYPAWHPDGSLIAFRSDRGVSPDIWVMADDGSDPRKFVEHPAEEGWSSWSPDGRWFYFTSNRSGAFNVWVMPASGGDPRQVTRYQGISRGLPEAALFTKFAITPSRLIFPLETGRGEIFLLEGFK